MSKLAVTIGVYVAGSALVFPYVYEASDEVIDEQFHLRQGLAYCNGNFDVWDPKITTFPGLYLVSTVLNYPLGTCSTWSLRLTSLLASVVNVWLICQIRRAVLQPTTEKTATTKHQASYQNIGMEALNIALLPPLYFFAHLYYTDVLSMTTVLALILFSSRHRHNWAALFGAFSVLMRQTNIVWVAMALGTTCLDKLVSQTLPFIKQNERYGRADHVYGFGDIGAVVAFYARRFYLLPKQVRLLITHLWAYVLVLLAFVAFVVWNGAIVVGDKQAHEARPHVPQLFYWALFTVVFGVAVWGPLVGCVWSDVRAYWVRTAVAGAAIAVAVAVNTIEHPYLLADNRHYTFYVWRRFYGAHEAARYAIIPVYVAALAAINAALAAGRTAGWRLCFGLCTVLALCAQQMIEVRYFLVPFVLVRLHAPPVGMRWLAVELLLYYVLNGAVFYVFVTKEIWWSDFEAVQRLIW